MMAIGLYVSACSIAFNESFRAPQVADLVYAAVTIGTGVTACPAMAVVRFDLDTFVVAKYFPRRA